MFFTGLVLAGGLSSRMGCDKTQLELNDVNMLDFARLRLSIVGADTVLINRNTFDEGTLPDIYPHHGPLSGIHAGLMECKTHGLLVMPVDMPLLTPRSLSVLIATAQMHNRPAHFEKHFLPCYIPVTEMAKTHLETLLQSDLSKSVSQFLHHHNALALKAIDESEMANVNTPEQWRAIKVHLNNIQP